MNHAGKSDVIAVCLAVIAHVSKPFADDRDKHAHAHEDHQQHEESEGHGTEHGLRLDQLLRVELHQDHFEEHLRGVQESRARGDVGEKE